MALLQLFKHKTELEETELKIQALKEKLLTLTERYTYDIYLVLKEIYELRKSQIRNYSIFTLTEENGISFTKQQIAYIFGYDHFTNKAWTMIKRSKVSPNLVLSVIKKAITFRKEKNLNAFLDKFEKGEINSSEIRVLDGYNLLTRVTSEEHMPDERKIFLTALYHIKAITKAIQDNPQFFKIASNKRILLQNQELFNKAVREVLK